MNKEIKFKEGSWPVLDHTASITESQYSNPDLFRSKSQPLPPHQASSASYL